MGLGSSHQTRITDTLGSMQCPGTSRRQEISKGPGIRGSTSAPQRGGGRGRAQSAWTERFTNEHWNQEYTIYEQDTSTFTGPKPGVADVSHRSVPSALTLFHKFWCVKSLRRIVHETNKRAKEEVDDNGNTYGGPKWKDLDVEEFTRGGYILHTFVNHVRLGVNYR
jgi:hypothetical protein